VFKQGCWSLWFIASLGILTFNLVQLTTAYMSFAVQVTVTMEQPTTVTFPVISVCNLSPFKRSAVLAYGSTPPLAATDAAATINAAAAACYY
jgi:hypothetical protein